MNSKNWKLFRCIYDSIGQYAIEGEYPKEHFERTLEKGYGDVGWIIGQPIIEHNNYITVKVILEGNKEVLEYILKLVQKEIKENGS